MNKVTSLKWKFLSVIIFVTMMIGSALFSLTLDTTAEAIGQHQDVLSFDHLSSNSASKPFLLSTTNSANITQNQNDLFELNWASSDTQGTTSVALGDMDGDGDLDLAVGNNKGLNIHFGKANEVYRNNGDGLFTLVENSGLQSEANLTSAVAWGDVDGDGDLDLVAGNFGTENKLYLNNGNGYFTPVIDGNLELGSDFTTSIALGDIDGDGDVDLVTGNTDNTYVDDKGEINKIYLNDGAGFFTLNSKSGLERDADYTTSIALGDIDGDGDLDLIAGNTGFVAYDDNGEVLVDMRGQVNKIYQNDGTGRFAPAIESGLESDADYTLSVAWGDMDNDGDLDLLVGNDAIAFENNDPNKVYQNDGRGKFVLIQNSGLEGEIESTITAAWGDMDRDGDLDVLVANSFNASQIYHNSGDGHFALIPESGLETEAGNLTSAAWGDFDGDGDLDIVVGNGTLNANYAYRNNHDGAFAETIRNELDGDPSATRSIAWGDMDGDGDLDLAIGNDFSQSNQIFRNHGNGTFSLVTNSGLEGDLGSSESIAWGDMDGDGDLDLAIGNNYDSNWVYRNNGAGYFDRVIEAGLEIEREKDSSSVAWGDMDGDGDLDLVAGTDVYENDGNGFFTQIEGGDNGSNLSFYITIALGDLDSDGDLDLVAGNNRNSNQIYRNDGSGVFTIVPKNGLENDASDTTSVALGDMDGDGDLDLAVGNDFAQIDKVYRNNGDGVFSLVPKSGLELDVGYTNAVAWGDVDGDGDLDLAVGVENESSKIYRNNGNGFFARVMDSGLESGQNTNAVAWGDADGDGDLDLAVGNDDYSTSSPFSSGNPKSKVYLNTHSNFPSHLPTNRPIVQVKQPFGISGADFFATGQKYESSIIPIPYTLLDTSSHRVGEVKGWYSLNGGGKWEQATPSTNNLSTNILPNGGPFSGLARYWRFEEGTGQKINDSSKYGENGTGSFITNSTWTTNTASALGSLSHVSADFDGSSSYAELSHFARPLRMTISAWINPDQISETSNIVGWNGESSTDAAELLIIDGTLNYCETVNDVSLCAEGPRLEENRWSHVAVVRNGDWENNVTLFIDGEPGSKGTANQILNTNSLSAGARANGKNAAQFFNGQIDDLRIYNRALTSSEIIQLANPVPEYTYFWDTSSSGFFGQSDNIVFRLEPHFLNSSSVELKGNELKLNIDQSVINVNNNRAVELRGNKHEAQQIYLPLVQFPDTRINDVASSYPAGQFLYGSGSGTTLPFSVRGKQVRVINENGAPLSQAIVYRQLQGEIQAEAIKNSAGSRVFWTDAAGYLQGQGELHAGDQLIALHPISSTLNYTIYQTSASPTLEGLETVPVSGSGVQTLTVSTDNHLILFDLIISLEWDARNDLVYLQQLKVAVQRASRILYDATNGQVALGKVDIYHNKAGWSQADVVIKASNQTRPVAALGGSVLTPTITYLTPDSAITSQLESVLTEDGLLKTVYLPGQITMPPRWSPFGNNQGELGEDWGRVLAHELGHYLFAIPDNYLGVDDDLNFKLVDCPLSLMDNPYLDQGSEFRFAGSAWEQECGHTMQDQYQGRSDWDSILALYPMLRAPSRDEQINLGPNRLPLTVTDIQFNAPFTPTQTLENHFFPLEDSEGRPLYVTSGRLAATLWKNIDNDDPADDYLVELGAAIPSGSSIEVWGAERGDRLCALNDSSDPPLFGCVDKLQDFAEPLKLKPITNWNPEVEIHYVSTTTVDITITNKALPISQLDLQLITPVGESSIIQTALVQQDGSFVARLIAPQGAYYGHISVLARFEDGPNEEVRTIIPIQNFSDWEANSVGWGGKGAGWGGKGAGWGGKGAGWGGKGAGWGGKGAGWGAPTVSEDAQLSIYPLKHIFDEILEYNIYKVPAVSNLPGYLTSVGQAYRIESTNALPDKAAILFNYLSLDVLGGSDNEHFINIYYLPNHDKAEWQRLPTEVNVQRNIAIADGVGEGTYLLAMAQSLSPLYADELNLIAWPVRRPILVSQALSFIEGEFDSVYSFDRVGNQWQVFDNEIDPAFEPFINTFTEMQLGSYWIWMNAPADPFLVPIDYMPQDSRANNVISAPPMIMYGFIDESLNAQIEDPINAIVNSTPCSSTEVIIVEGRAAFVLEIPAISPQGELCGSYGAEITLKLKGIEYETPIFWTNRQVAKFDLITP